MHRGQGGKSAMPSLKTNEEEIVAKGIF